MSHTNSTQNYQLPQFIGSDIPGWLTDFNSAMLKIDQGMNAAKTAADAAGTTAGQAASDVTTINNTLTTQANQISAAAQAASSAQTSAGAAQNTADANTQSITALDTRVQALEAGGGTSGLTYFTKTATVSFSASNNIFVAAFSIADELQTAGISYTDVKSIALFEPVGNFGVILGSLSQDGRLLLFTSGAYPNVSITVTVGY